MQDKLKKLVKLVILNTVEKNIPTLVFLSEIDEVDLIKSVISILLKKEYDENKFTFEDWNELVDIILKLGNIPLVIKMVDSVEKTIEQINNFSTELKDNKGYVIIECTDDDFNNLKNNQNLIVEII